jgi:hypothetical protein
MTASTGASRIPAKRETQELANDYSSILAQVKRMIGDSRWRALSAVNGELVWLYWQIGRIIVRQQEQPGGATLWWSNYLAICGELFRTWKA